MPQDWRNLLQKAGVTPENAADPATARFITQILKDATDPNQNQVQIQPEQSTAEQDHHEVEKVRQEQLLLAQQAEQAQAEAEAARFQQDQICTVQSKAQQDEQPALAEQHTHVQEAQQQVGTSELQSSQPAVQPSVQPAAQPAAQLVTQIPEATLEHSADRSTALPRSQPPLPSGAALVKGTPPPPPPKPLVTATKSENQQNGSLLDELVSKTLKPTEKADPSKIALPKAEADVSDLAERLRQALATRRPGLVRETEEDDDWD